jgi:cyclopropane fatty-acyl-phospholipid synthase-like methyltransferase
LDFGAGRGELVSALSEQGANCCAVDPFGADHLTAQRIEAYRSIEELPSGSVFDGILAVDVLEHLSRPWTALHGLRQLLRKGGWLYVATPNPACVSALVRRARWADARNLSHLMLFKPGVLKDMLHDAGFERVMRLRWFVPHWQSTSRRWLGYALQGISMDGVLRYLARLPGSR